MGQVDGDWTREEVEGKGQIVPPILLVAVGGVLGANARFLIANWSVGRFGRSFPYGTLIVNLSGSFLLGFLATLIGERFDGDRTASLLIGTGFLGAYTTFSTFSVETLAQVQIGEYRRAAVNVAISTGGGVVVALLGIWRGLLVS